MNYSKYIYCAAFFIQSISYAMEEGALEKDFQEKGCLSLQSRAADEIIKHDICYGDNKIIKELIDERFPGCVNDYISKHANNTLFLDAQYQEVIFEALSKDHNLLLVKFMKKAIKTRVAVFRNYNNDVKYEDFVLQALHCKSYRCAEAIIKMGQLSNYSFEPLEYYKKIKNKKSIPDNVKKKLIKAIEANEVDKQKILEEDWGNIMSTIGKPSPATLGKF